MSNTTPFEKYMGRGRILLGPPGSGDGSCRHGYGPPVFEQCGRRCVYCDRDLFESYESWLDVSVDHVVPRSTAWYQRKKQYIEDMFNLVTCCRACNEFLNQYQCDAPEPATVEEFTVHRDLVFREKRQLAEDRHMKERLAFIRKTGSLTYPIQ
jgi:hypothetical protein